MDRRELQQILKKYLDGEVTPQEKRFVEEYYAYFDKQPGAMEGFDAMLMQRHREEVLAQMQQGEAPVVPMRRRGWMKYAAAAIIIIGVGAYLWNIQKEKTDSSLVHQQSVPVKNDVEPGGNKAVLVLADGKKIVLDSAANGELSKQAGAVVVKTADGQLEYRKVGDVIPVNAMNSVSTPRGGQYQLVLPDGTKVWLNAASSITYPTAFTESERKVSIAGEVYFEVAKDKAKPFVVRTAQQTVTVLGTHFNMSSYAEEKETATTLLEGSVRVRANGQEQLLRPGQQAILRDEDLSVRENIDVNAVVAWKNGEFDFSELDFATSMRQIERWYDVNVVYDGPVPQTSFLGTMKRDLTLNEMLDGLSGVVATFRLEGRTLHVLPETTK